MDNYFSELFLFFSVLVIYEPPKIELFSSFQILFFSTNKWDKNIHWHKANFMLFSPRHEIVECIESYIQTVTGSTMTYLCFTWLQSHIQDVTDDSLAYL